MRIAHRTIPGRTGSPCIGSCRTERLPVFADKPMLIGWGDRDFVFDHHFLAEWQRRFPKAELHRYPDCGHYILEDAAEELIPLIREFLLWEKS
jgi:cis-3-alkyl-4-acyloxetan-2-one decarboxylase